MNTKNGKKGIGIVLAAIMVASVFAAAMPAMVSAAEPAGSEVEEGSTTKWGGADAGSDVSYGGNITEINLSATTQTGKWQGYYGNVTEMVTLRDGSGKAMFNWTATAVASGEAIATTNDSADWGKTLDNSTGAMINSSWSFGEDADNAKNTFSDGAQTVTINGKYLETARAQTYNSTGGLTWNTAAAIGLLDGNGTAKADFLFAGIISANSESYKGTTVDFQMIVPTTKGGGSDTYYFYVEL